jgi:phosphoribosyl-ATP pyrophosphohydrolase/phosphoribosyl-AMP cyclohydrolase/histidinol dehydrogenase
MIQLRRIATDDLALARVSLPNRETLAEAARIVDDVRARGEAALLEHAQRLGDWRPGDPVTWDAASLLPREQRDLLERTASRIRTFAEAQRSSVTDLTVEVPGGRAGHTLAPVDSAGCYAPGGRFPLPSSVLMTAVTARAAGVGVVWVASPRPAAITLAAAAVAGADGVLAVGGAQAIAALAFGAGPVPPCDLIVGPGNRYVTAAKQVVAGHVGIDMLAGPSELVVLADRYADPGLVAADLLAQAEHDPDAVPILVTPSLDLAHEVDRAIDAQLRDLPTASVASRALTNGGVVVVASMEQGVEICNRLAPEHLEVIVADPQSLMSGLRHYGALFLGSYSAEVLGDYGAGPNHVLPTGGTARRGGGLSVMTFLRMRTWLQIDDPRESTGLINDAVSLSHLEGLEGHARSAWRRSAIGRAPTDQSAS